MSETMLKVSGVSAHYGSINAVKDASLEVRQGEAVTVIGANGAGKSTLMKCIVGAQERRYGGVPGPGYHQDAIGQNRPDGNCHGPGGTADFQ